MAGTKKERKKERKPGGKYVVFPVKNIHYHLKTIKSLSETY